MEVMKVEWVGDAHQLSGEFSATQAQREVVKMFFLIFPTGLEVHIEDMF